MRNYGGGDDDFGNEGMQKHWSTTINARRVRQTMGNWCGTREGRHTASMQASARNLGKLFRFESVSSKGGSKLYSFPKNTAIPRITYVAIARPRDFHHLPSFLVSPTLICKSRSLTLYNISRTPGEDLFCFLHNAQSISKEASHPPSEPPIDACTQALPTLSS